MALKIFQKNRIEIELLIGDTVDYTVEQFGQSRTNYTAASAYGQIILVLENLAQLILYYIEDSITELNINTATRTNSIYGLARLAGHNPTRAISASGEVALSLLNGAPLSDVSGGQIVIPNYTRIKCMNNGLTYLIDLPGDEFRMPTDGSRNGATFRVVQGDVETQQFTGTGADLQSYSLNFQQSGMVEQHRVQVFVNGEQWQRYDAFYDMPRDAKGFVQMTAINSGLDIYFGNRYNGAVPPLGAEIRVEYLVSNGAAGNLRLSADTEAMWRWEDPAYSLFGDELDLNQLVGFKTPVSPDFGSNPEGVELTRLVAPRTSRSFVLANPTNYIVFLEKLNQFSIIDAYQRRSFNNPLNLPGVGIGGQSPTVELDDSKIVYLFLVPDVRRQMTSADNYFTLDERLFKLDDQRKQRVLDLIERSGSKVLGTEVQIVDPRIARFVINVAVIIFSDVPESMVRSEIEQRLSEYFLNCRRRDRIPRSDLIAVVEQVHGVDSVNLSVLSELDERQFVEVSTGQRGSEGLEAPRIDGFGDIIIRERELPIVRGGWTDRYGTSYSSSVGGDGPGALNIIVQGVVDRTYNSEQHQRLAR